MNKRKCDACGKMRAVRRAKVCEKGHFICSSCHSSLLGSRKTCPLCRKKLR